MKTVQLQILSSCFLSNKKKPTIFYFFNKLKGKKRKTTSRKITEKIFPGGFFWPRTEIVIEMNFLRLFWMDLPLV